MTIVCVLPSFLTGAFAVQVREELNFGRAALGGVVALYRGAAAVLSVPMGLLVERAGASAGMRAAALASAAAMVAVAVAADGWLSLASCLLLAALAFSLGHAAVNLFLTRTVHPDRRGLAFGFKHSAVPTATLLAGFAVPAVALTVGWRAGFLAAAVGAFLAAAIVPSGRGERAARSTRAPVRREPVRLAPFVFAALAFGLSMAAASALGVFLVDTAVAAGIEPGRAGLLLAVGSVAAITTRLVSGGRADRRPGGHLRTVTGMLCVGVLGYLLLATQSVPLIVIGTVLAFGMGWGFNGLFWLAVVELNPQAPAAATGKVMTGGQIGGMVGPVLFGVLVDHVSYTAAWSVAACWGVCGAAAMILFERFTVKQQRQVGTAPSG